MTNSSHAGQSSSFFKSLSFFLVIVSAILLTFIGVQVITNSSDIAHADEIANPTELNAEYFADGATESIKTADSNELSNTGSILAQAETQTDASSGQCNYLTDDLRIDFNNDSQQVYKLQAFLQAYEYDYVDLNGNFDEDTLRAVQEFQTTHADDVLEPWGYESDEATGYVYITTRQKINEIYCNQELELSASAQQEIASYRQRLNQWRAQGADFDTPNYLAQYQAQRSTSDEITDTTVDNEQDESESPVVVRQSDDSDDDNEQEISGTSTTATDTDETDDESGFFARLFGQDEEGDSSEGNQADTATNAENTADSDQEEADGTTSTNDSATGTVATTGVDQAATSVYSGVNSFVGFIFSPTFLLILLGVLILLLIATLLEGDEETAYADVTADDLAKDFGDTTETDRDEEVAMGADTEKEPNDEKEERAKTDSADFDDTPAGNKDDEAESKSEQENNEDSETNR